MSEEHDTTTEERAGGARGKLNRGLGMLSAFRDALEETIHEARERGDLSTDRAKEAIRGAYEKARTASSDARDRFDFVGQAEFDALARRVADLEERVRSRISGDEAPEDPPE